mmetsp:Transcript_72842/g.194430  ORF Transcript_72842/g.194430 Transcript_72842/m.194430 type:complete len:205 (+) Transcript_72842:293-907(+)
MACRLFSSACTMLATLSVKSLMSSQTSVVDDSNALFMLPKFFSTSAIPVINWSIFCIVRSCHSSSLLAYFLTVMLLKKFFKNSCFPSPFVRALTLCSFIILITSLARIFSPLITMSLTAHFLTIACSSGKSFSTLSRCGRRIPTVSTKDIANPDDFARRELELRIMSCPQLSPFRTTLPPCIAMPRMTKHTIRTSGMCSLGMYR